MQKRINIESVSVQEDALIFYAEHSDIQAEQLQPKEHVLVDSDHLAFLYILEADAQFLYVSIPHTMWQEMKQALENHKEAAVHINGIRIPLIRLQEEVEYLVENIEGNANYGEELVAEVEKVFL